MTVQAVFIIMLCLCGIVGVVCHRWGVSQGAKKMFEALLAAMDKALEQWEKEHPKTEENEDKCSQ